MKRNRGLLRKRTVRTLSIFVVFVTSLAAQNAAVKITNASRPGSTGFQVGDRFEVMVTGAPNLPVSVRTMRQGRTDWGPVIAYTDAGGRWSTQGRFEKQDFGQWSENWTVGGKLANPAIVVSVTGTCLPGGQSVMNGSGPNVGLGCDTATGHQSFVTPSDGDSFRTPDGRVIRGRSRSAMTAEEFGTEVIVSAITGSGNVRPGKRLSASVSSISRIIGVNALTEKETETVIAISHAVFEGQFRAKKSIPPLVALLQQLANEIDQASLKQQLAETIAFVQNQ
jgi:hypothetical protein